MHFPCVKLKTTCIIVFDTEDIWDGGLVQMSYVLFHFEIDNDTQTKLFSLFICIVKWNMDYYNQ